MNIKKNIITNLLLSSCFIASVANAQQSDIPYQNSNNAVNTKPSSSPQQQISNNEINDNYEETVDESGNRVINKTQVNRLTKEERAGAQQVDYSSMSPQEKFWKLPNEKIKELQKNYEAKMNAIGTDPTPGKCVQNSVDVSSQPGDNLPLIRLDKNNISTVLVTDVYGKPWSIDYIVNSNDVKIVYDQDNPEVSSFSIQSNNNNGQGNFVVKLKENPVPIVFSFVNNQKNIDCMLVAKLTKQGPNTNIKTETLSASAMDSSLNSTLYGVAPKDSKLLKTTNSAAQAWRLPDGKVIIRTKFKLLSPAYESVTRSPDGTYVYKTQYSPVFTYRYNDLIDNFKISK